MSPSAKKVAIIGGGLAGLSLATELVDEGLEVIVLEKHHNLGGRASNTFDRKMADPVPIGPHVFVTAYNNFRRFLEKIGAEESISWERKIFLEVIYHRQHYQFKISHIPRPLYMLPWILKYPFIDWQDKLSHFRLALHITFSTLKDFEKIDELNTYDFLRELGVSNNSIDKFWRFFVLTMLNIPIELCSAAEFAQLIKNWSRLKNKKFGFAKIGLGDIYTEAAEGYIRKRSGSLLRNTYVTKASFKDNRVDHLVTNQNGQIKKIKADIYVSTINPIELRNILPEEMCFTDFFRNLNRFEAVPYISVNLWFDRKISDKKFWALLNDSDTPQYINTDFYDQSNIYSTRKNHSFITSNIIYSKPYENMPDKEIVNKTIGEIKEVFSRFDGKLKHYHIHRIPYVIYAPFPGMRKHKLSNKTPIENFYLAGDWTIKELTQCMESAVRSGYRCAEVMLKDLGIEKKICNEKIV